MKKGTYRPELFLVLAAVIMSLLAGCGAREAGPEEVTGNFCEALKQFDVEAMQPWLLHADADSVRKFSEELDNVSAESPDLSQYFREKMAEIEYSVGSPSVSGDTANVSVRFTHADITPAVLSATVDYVQQAFMLTLAGASESTIQQLMYTTIITKLNTIPAITANTDVEFSCLHTRDGWKIDSVSKDALANVLTCNLLNALDSDEAPEENVGSLSDTPETPEISGGDEARTQQEPPALETVQNETETRNTSAGTEPDLSAFLGTWEGADGGYPVMEITSLGGGQCQITITNKYAMWEAVGAYQANGSIVYTNGTFSERDRGSDWELSARSYSGSIWPESGGRVSWNSDQDEYYNEIFVRPGAAAGSVASGGGDAEAVAHGSVFGETIWEADADGWAGEWLFLYIYGDSDPSPSQEAEISHTKPTTDTLLYGISYEEADAAGWGDIWLAIMEHMDYGDEDYDEDYLLPSDSQYITAADLADHTREELSLMRNEIYARYGYNFQNEEIRDYFLSQDWYVPVAGVNADTFGTNDMNIYERANLETIMDYEREMGWRN